MEERKGRGIKELHLLEGKRENCKESMKGTCPVTWGPGWSRRLPGFFPGDLSQDLERQWAPQVLPVLCHSFPTGPCIPFYVLEVATQPHIALPLQEIVLQKICVMWPLICFLQFFSLQLSRSHSPFVP